MEGTTFTFKYVDGGSTKAVTPPPVQPTATNALTQTANSAIATQAAQGTSSGSSSSPAAPAGGGSLGSILGGALGSMIAPGIGTAIGAALGPMIQDTLESLNPITILKNKFNELADAADKAAQAIGPMSAAIAAAEAQQTVLDVQRSIARGNQVGTEVAGFQRAKNDVGYQLQRISDAMLAPMLEIATSILRILEPILEKVADFTEWSKDQVYALLTEIVDNLSKLPLIGDWVKGIRDVAKESARKADEATEWQWDQFAMVGSTVLNSI